jgi:hypothetical protein
VTLNRARVECKMANPCIPCTYGIAHPPVLAVYDPETGEYVLTEGRVCMARWAVGNNRHPPESICGLPVAEEAGDVDVCTHHLKRLYDWRWWEKPRKDVEEKAQAIRDACQDYRQAEADRAALHEKLDAEHSVVYFIRRASDGAVKIGTSTAFVARMRTLRAEFGELQVLLTISGGRIRERQMHERFRKYRLRRTEWFAPTRALLEWIYIERGSYAHRVSQQPDVVERKELRKLSVRAPRDRDLQFKDGIVVWPLSVAA